MPPVLIHIGYHKTATSWLQRTYFRNPESGLHSLGKRQDDHPVRKLILARPLEFDASASRAEFEPLLEKAEEKGFVPVVSFERLSGHASSGGYDGKEIAERLRAVFPEGRVLAVIREQQGMIVSTYKQYIRGGGPGTLRAFLEPATTTNARLPTFDYGHFEYDRLLGHYHGLFGAENVHALTFEQFLREPREFVSAIARFAGRPLSAEVLDALPFDRKRNKTLTPAMLGLLRRANHVIRSDLNPTPMLEAPFPQRLRRLTQSPRLESLVPARLEARWEAALRRDAAELIGDRYRESNRRTAELTGLDLAAYGWLV